MRRVKAIIVSALILLLVGCRTKESVTTERASASTQIERVLADSIIIRDSIVIQERHDTVYFTKYHTLYKERLRYDTVVKCDTVYTERVVTVKERSHFKGLWLLLSLAVLVLLWRVGFFDLIRKKMQ